MTPLIKSLGELDPDNKESQRAVIAAAFGRLQELARQMLRCAGQNVQNETATGSIMNRVVVRLIRKLKEPRSKDRQQFLSWLTWLVESELRTIRRKLQTKPLRLDQSAQDSDGKAWEPPEKQNELRQKFEEWDFLDLIYKLPKRQREVLRLRYFLTYEVQEVARELGITPRAALKRETKARLRLRELLPNRQEP